MSNEQDDIVYLKDYQPFPFEILTIDLSFDIAPGAASVETKLTISPATNSHANTSLFLHGDGLSPVHIAIDGTALDKSAYTVSDHGLEILSPPTQPFTLETGVRLEPEANKSLMGLYRSGGVWCTQCEAEGFRRITYMADRPDVLSKYRVRIEAGVADAPVLLSNGNLVDSGKLEGGRHFAVWEDPFPKPTYLFALVAGDLGVIRDKFTTRSGREVALSIYCEHGKEDRCTFAMDALKRSMAWDETRFGREYDLDLFNIVAVSDFNFGAMENKGLNIFNDKLILATPQTATDADYERIESVVAHEYFHNWTGNRVTCRDWFQLCLKEGLTVFRDQEFTSDERSRAVKRIEDVLGLRSAQFPEDEGPLSHAPRPDHYREINNFYTATVYQKGAEVVRMLATLLGEADFRKGTDLYFERHDGEATTIESWLKVFEDVTGRDLSQFGLWYTQAGTPEVSAAGTWDEASKTYRLNLTQRTAPTPGQAEKSALLVPMKFGLVGPNGEAQQWETVSGGTVEGNTILLDQDQMALEFTGVGAKPVLSLLQAFSAPVNLKQAQSRDDKFFLARHDKDSFNRWQALQDVATDMMVSASRSGLDCPPEEVSALADALEETLQSPTLDDAFKALVLTLPGELSVARAMVADVDPARVHTVHGDLVSAVAGSMRAKLKDCYDTLGTADDTSQSVADVHARGLRNQCLSLLVRSGDTDMADLAGEHYRRATNMTDRMGALSASVTNWTVHAQTLLDDFGGRFAGDALVRDKWLALNALRPDAEVLGRVAALYDDPDFPKTNPNRMRSLVGTYAINNPAQFTRVDGKGFQFVADVCRATDKHNPQLAARLLTSFRTWRSLEPVRREQAGAILANLAESQSLSRDLKDILTRLLAA